MAQFAQGLFDSGFAIGVARYLDRYLDQEDPRIVVMVNVAGVITVPAIVDTGASWCVIDPEIFAEIADRIPASAPVSSLLIRGVLYEGNLVRLTMRLEVDAGQSPEIDGTVFVPTLPPNETWSFPNFLGLHGFLERVRFAVDPGDDMFYLGSV